jgi:ATP-binding cassette subfamily C (CFTR/MRP) protein 1
LPFGQSMYGAIEIKNVSMRYRPGLPLVFNGLDLSVLGRSSVGIVRRSGAGKSSLMTALTRLMELDLGHVMLDGVFTKDLGLHQLRLTIEVIPQGPFVFSGTLGNNLDPFNMYSEENLREVLQ